MEIGTETVLRTCLREGTFCLVAAQAAHAQTWDEASNSAATSATRSINTFGDVRIIAAPVNGGDARCS